MVSVTRRILLHVASAAGLVIVVATGVTYWKVYNAAAHRDLRHLDIYVRERARREEVVFAQVEANLRLVRGQFLKRMEEPAPADLAAQWERRFRRFADGSWRSREEYGDARRFATLWAHRNVQFTPELQTQVLRAQAICDELLPGWADKFPSVYFVLPGWLNIGFDPRLPTWVWDTPADYDASALEWFHLALPPVPAADGLSWTGVIEEPTTKFPMVSVYLPVWREGRFVGSIGHDIDVSRLLHEIVQTQLPGITHMIFRRDGRLIAHPEKLPDILASKGTLRLQDGGEELASLYRNVSARAGRDGAVSGYDAASRHYYSAAQLNGPDWIFLTMLPRERLQEQAFNSAQWVLWSGLSSLALVLGFLATILRRQVAHPLAELTRATHRMAEGDHQARAAVLRPDEFGALAGAFNDMAGHVASRDAELRQLNQELEERVEQRTAELTEANRRLDEGRAEALRLLAQERELREMKSDFVSLVSHEFRTPLEIIMSSVDNLDRYHDRLAPEKRTQLLQTINKAVRRMAGMMEEALVLGRLETDRMAFRPKPFDLSAFVRRVADEIASATNNRCPIQVELESGLPAAQGDEEVVRHIATNLLSNAVKYSPPGAPVLFQVRRDGQRVVMRISDHGCGIPEPDQARLFQAFHRGSNVRQIPGTGLGLLIVQRCVALHGGELSFQSRENEGTVFTVRLPVFTAGDA